MSSRCLEIGRRSAIWLSLSSAVAALVAWGAHLLVPRFGTVPSSYRTLVSAVAQYKLEEGELPPVEGLCRVLEGMPSGGRLLKGLRRSDGASCLFRTRAHTLTYTYRGPAEAPSMNWVGAPMLVRPVVAKVFFGMWLLLLALGFPRVLAAERRRRGSD